MAKLFICYRRNDEQHAVGRLRKELEAYFRNPADDIFVDVESILPGNVYKNYLEERVTECEIFLIVIGPKWLFELKQKADDPIDYVRMEIAAAIKNDVRIVPVLLDGTPIPPQHELPEDLQPLTDHHGVIIHHTSFTSDVERLAKGLGLSKEPNRIDFGHLVKSVSSGSRATLDNWFNRPSSPNTEDEVEESKAEAEVDPPYEPTTTPVTEDEDQQTEELTVARERDYYFPTKTKPAPKTEQETQSATQQVDPSPLTPSGQTFEDGTSSQQPNTLDSSELFDEPGEVTVQSVSDPIPDFQSDDLPEESRESDPHLTPPKLDEAAPSASEQSVKSHTDDNRVSISIGQDPADSAEQQPAIETDTEFSFDDENFESEIAFRPSTKPQKSRAILTFAMFSLGMVAVASASAFYLFPGTANEMYRNLAAQFGDGSATLTSSTSATFERTVLRDCNQCPELVVLPPGSFSMGSPDTERGRRAHEGPVREVNIQKPFAIGKYEVTWDQWHKCMQDRYCSMAPTQRNSDLNWSWGKSPAVHVSWYEAQKFVEWLRDTTGENYRLPSEAEWEYAARAGSTTAYIWGSHSSAGCAYANGADESARPLFQTQENAVFMNCDDRYATTAPVGTYVQNEWDLFDMTGNVREWVQDCYHEDYSIQPTDGSAFEGGEDCDYRVIRGGAWNQRPSKLRAASRAYERPGINKYSFGLRVARDVDPSEL